MCEAQETRGSKFTCEFGRNSTVYCFVASGFLTLLKFIYKRIKKVATSDMKLATTMAQRVGFEPTGDCSHDGFRVFYSQHTLADFEKKCPILRVNALVRKKVLSSPLRLLPTARNARELSERTNRISIKHNSRKSP